MTISQYPQFNCFNFYFYSKLINNVITRLLRKSAKRLPINGIIRYALTDGTYLSHKACILAMALGVAPMPKPHTEATCTSNKHRSIIISSHNIKYYKICIKYY